MNIVISVQNYFKINYTYLEVKGFILSPSLALLKGLVCRVWIGSMFHTALGNLLPNSHIPSATVLKVNPAHFRPLHI
jgi:hypothetical protein